MSASSSSSEACLGWSSIRGQLEPEHRPRRGPEQPGEALQRRAEVTGHHPHLVAATRRLRQRLQGLVGQHFRGGLPALIAANVFSMAFACPWARRIGRGTLRLERAASGTADRPRRPDRGLLRRGPGSVPAWRLGLGDRGPAGSPRRSGSPPHFPGRPSSAFPSRPEWTAAGQCCAAPARATRSPRWPVASSRTPRSWALISRRSGSAPASCREHVAQGGAVVSCSTPTM